jgi:hypothetical protein
MIVSDKRLVLHRFLVQRQLIVGVLNGFALLKEVISCFHVANHELLIKR